jgi:hypothetical protein
MAFGSGALVDFEALGILLKRNFVCLHSSSALTLSMAVMLQKRGSILHSTNYFLLARRAMRIYTERCRSVG